MPMNPSTKSKGSLNLCFLSVSICICQQSLCRRAFFGALCIIKKFKTTIMNFICGPINDYSIKIHFENYLFLTLLSF